MRLAANLRITQLWGGHLPHVVCFWACLHQGTNWCIRIYIYIERERERFDCWLSCTLHYLLSLSIRVPWCRFLVGPGCSHFYDIFCVSKVLPHILICSSILELSPSIWFVLLFCFYVYTYYMQIRSCTYRLTLVIILLVVYSCIAYCLVIIDDHMALLTLLCSAELQALANFRLESCTSLVSLPESIGNLQVQQPHGRPIDNGKARNISNSISNIIGNRLYIYMRKEIYTFICERIYIYMHIYVHMSLFLFVP